MKPKGPWSKSRIEEFLDESRIPVRIACLGSSGHPVLASLWSVQDRSTAGLMERFYRELREGAGKDEALRAAQVQLIRGAEETSHPYHWAAFQLIGDWR